MPFTGYIRLTASCLSLQEELLEVNAALESESSEILKQRGQLEREAMSITEQMSVEAQVCCTRQTCLQPACRTIKIL